MKKFMSRYSYESVVLFLNQVAIGLFGMVLALAAGMADNNALRTATGIFSVIFFLFIQYTAMWKIGANDRISCDLGKLKPDYSVPLKMWLLANSLNLLLALLISIGLWFPNVEFLSSMGGIAATIKLIIEGMYTGLLAINIGGAALNSYWFMHFLTPLPALAIIFLGYILGFKNVAFGNFYGPSRKGK